MSEVGTPKSQIEITESSLPVFGKWGRVGKVWLPSNDSFGVLASVACAIHCAAMPFVIGLLPMLGLEFLAKESFHQWMAGVCFLIALAAFVPGWRNHRRILPVSVAMTGLALISLSAFGFLGDCCLSCGPSDANQANLIRGEGASATSVCTHSCCAGGTEMEELTIAGTRTAETPPPLSLESVGNFITENGVWWTPLGGFFLIAGHLLNRRCICSGGHCGTVDA